MTEPRRPEYSLSHNEKKFIVASVAVGVLACLSILLTYALFGETIKENRQARASATEPISTATPKPSATPRPTQTPKFTQTPRPTQTPKPGPTVKPTAVPWDVTVKELAEMPLPSIPKPQSFETVKPRAVLKGKLGRPIYIEGTGFQLGESNGRLIVAIETSSLMFYSEPFLVISEKPLVGQQDFRNMMIAEGIYIGKTTASSRMSENAEMPIVMAYGVEQTNIRLDFEPLPLR